MRIGLQFLLIIILCLAAAPVALDPQYHAGLALRQVAAEPVQDPEIAPLYHILDDLTPTETSFLVQTTLIAPKGEVVFRVNLFDYLLAWVDQLDRFAQAHPDFDFSGEWHRLLKSWAAKTSTKHILSGNAFLKALGQSPLAEEIVIYFLQEHLANQLQDRLFKMALNQQPIWGDAEDLLASSSSPAEEPHLTCSVQKRWPQLNRWIKEVIQIRPRPLGSRPYRQLNGGTFIIKKYLPWRLWQWPLGPEENKLAATISELWSIQQIGQQDLCTALSGQRGQRALRDLGLSPLPTYVPDGHASALKRLNQYAAHPAKNLPAVYQIYCRRMLIPQIFNAPPSNKEQKRHQLELQIALRDLER